MKFRLNSLLSLVFLVPFSSYPKTCFCYRDDQAGFTAKMTGKLATSTDTNINASINNGNAKGAEGRPVDRAYVNKTKFDLTGNITHDNGVEAQLSLRSKVGWGTRKNITTASEGIKIGEALIGSHSHNLEPRIVFVREAWLSMDFDKLCDRIYGGLNTFKLGLFPFSVARGIAFGDSFSVNPVSLGFFSDKGVDQYAPGILFSGDLHDNRFHYDIYGSIAKNRSTGLSDTAAQIYDNKVVDGAYLPANQFSRGFGNFDVSSVFRAQWKPYQEKGKKVCFEPYAVCVYGGEQKIDATGDAKHILGTFGFAGELDIDGIEFGFDTAFNRGHQNVSGLDRNKVEIAVDSVTGALKTVYSHVYDDAALTTKTIYTQDTAAYRPTGVISSSLNGLEINSTGKYSGTNRFRDPYKNKFRGWMGVVDAAMSFREGTMKVSVAGGVASGDVNPNKNKTGSVREYNGFISQQELYGGKRVKSVFVMGPSRALVRPNPVEDATTKASGAEGFSNIVFGGMGIDIAPADKSKGWKVNPNVLLFWQEHRSTKFNSTDLASNRLGTELNVIGSMVITENLKFSGSAALFLPGKYYYDIKGTALSSDVASMVKEAQAGVAELLPTLGNDPAFSLSVGMAYSF